MPNFDFWIFFCQRKLPKLTVHLIYENSDNKPLQINLVTRVPSPVKFLYYNTISIITEIIQGYSSRQSQ